MRFAGIVGYAIPTTVRPGVSSDAIIEKKYKGYLLRTMSRVSGSEHGVNDNTSFSNKVEIVADPFVNEHFHQIRFVVWKGVALKVSSVDVSDYPKAILEIGGVYNGKRAEPTS